MPRGDGETVDGCAKLAGRLMGVLVVGAGLFATTNVSAAPVINGTAIGEAVSTSLPVELVQHRREESREPRHRREESRERR
jgi:hypothetical protein